MPKLSKPRIAIVGAGIGGMTLGLLLEKAGYGVHIYEQASALGEVGAGLTLSKGAQSTLAVAGVLDEVRAAALVSATIPFLHYQTGERLAGEYDHSDGTGDGSALVGRQIHRADLHAILTAAFSRGGGDLSLDHRLVDVRTRPEGVALRFADGSTAEADLLIGADGLRSAVRAVLFGGPEPIFTQQVAWRFLVPYDAAAPYMGAGRAAVYFGPEMVFNRYTVRRAALVNCVFLQRTDQWAAEGWSTEGDPAALLQMLDGWSPDVVELARLSSPQTLRRWGLFHRDPLPVWRDGAATLLGDAAHPAPPFLGLGAAMAIEDAMMLTRALAAEPGLAAALDLYEAVRKPRTGEVLRQSLLQGELLQSRDPNRYDGAVAPASDRTFFDYDPVTAPLAPH